MTVIRHRCFLQKAQDGNATHIGMTQFILIVQLYNWQVNWSFITARKVSCGKVMFSQVSVHRGVVVMPGPKSLRGGGGGYAWSQVPARGYPQYQVYSGGGYMGGWVYWGYTRGGHNREGVDIPEGGWVYHGMGGYTRGWVYQVYPLVYRPHQCWHLVMTTQADGTYPTGMLFCSAIFSVVRWVTIQNLYQ